MKKRRRTMILVEAFGDHSNRLFQSIHFQAYCLEAGIDFHNPTLSDLYHDYPNLRPVDSTAGLPLLLWNLAKWGLARPIRPASISDLEEQASKNVLLVAGWEFRCHDLTWKYREELLAPFLHVHWNKPEELLRQRILEWRDHGHAIVAVHIRRGDYREYQNGIYYFDDSAYQEIIDRVAILVQESGKTPAFVLFSNEQHSIRPEHDFVVSDARWNIDHMLMAMCDLIVGPPSTFSLWASYLGNTPFYHFRAGDARIGLDEFTVCHG